MQCTHAHSAPSCQASVLAVQTTCGAAQLCTAFSVTLRLGTAAACCLPPACLQDSTASPALRCRGGCSALLHRACCWVMGCSTGLGTGCISSFCSSLCLSCFSHFTVCQCPSVLTDGGQHELYHKHSCMVSAFGDRISVWGPDSGILQMLGIALYRAVTAAASLGTDIPQHLTDAHPALLSGIGWGREESCTAVPVLPRPGLCLVRRSTLSGFCH